MTTGRPGRRPSTSHKDLALVAIRLFTERGFDETTVDDIAAAAGISSRTFFTYFPSKSDTVWAGFDLALARLARRLAAHGSPEDLLSALQAAILEYHDTPPDLLEAHRERVALAIGVAALQATTALRYEEWRRVVEQRVLLELPPGEASLLSHLVLAVEMWTARQWVDGVGSVDELIRAGFGRLRQAYG